MAFTPQSGYCYITVQQNPNYAMLAPLNPSKTSPVVMSHINSGLTSNFYNDRMLWQIVAGNSGISVGGMPYGSGIIFVNKHHSNMALWGTTESILGVPLGNPWPYLTVRPFASVNVITGFPGPLPASLFGSAFFDCGETTSCIWTTGADDNGYCALRPVTNDNYNANVSRAGGSSPVTNLMQVIIFPWRGTKDNMRWAPSFIS